MSDRRTDSNASSAEREELDRVLNSPVFLRAPLLSHFLSYICRLYFEGRSEEIKEYNIAVDALGRSADFDHLKDSIVRVEAHRLRKRLRQYYEDEGAENPLRLEIPTGHYVPVFIPNPMAPVPVPEPEPAEEMPLPEPVPQPEDTAPTRRLPAVLLAILGVGAVALLATWGINRPASAIREPGLAPGASVTTPAAADPLDAVLRTNAGGGFEIDEIGRVWDQDQFYSGGEVTGVSPAQPVAPWSPGLYRSARKGRFHYEIPLDPAIYELRLYFAETEYSPSMGLSGSSAFRLFNVLLNEKLALRDFDIASDAGGVNQETIKVFKDVAPGPGGLLRLDFVPVKNEVLLQGIEVLKGLPGRTHPIRILAGQSAYHHGPSGQLWSADWLYSGGTRAPRSQRVANATDTNLYSAERYGNFRYVLPASPDSTYRLVLHFAETWFGPENPGRGGEGSRRFDVFCNGEALLRDFDVYSEAGGENRAVVRTFTGIRPTPQGKIVLHFSPIVNYAEINAIELIDES